MNFVIFYLGIAGRILSTPVVGPIVFPLHALLFKILRAEGVLLAVNLTLFLTFTPFNLFIGVKVMALSALVLAQLYGFNDVHDAPDDARDPDKPEGIAASILKSRVSFFIASIGWMVVLTIGAYLFIPGSLYGVLAMFGINMLYSIVFKGIPVADVFAVAAWGGCFPLVLGVDIPIDFLVAIACMTGVSHVWQTMRDKDADGKLGITTVAVFSKIGSLGLVAVLCGIVACIGITRLTGNSRLVLGLLCTLPLFLFFFVRRIRIVWLVTKLTFAVVWIFLLNSAVRT